MAKPTELFFKNWERHFFVLLLLLTVQLCACAEREEPEKKERVQKQPIGIITTTSYCLSGITAADAKIKPGYIALSHDIEKKHQLKFGDLIYAEGETEPYVFMDRMPLRWKRRADLYTKKCKDAKEYAVHKRMLWFVRKK